MLQLTTRARNPLSKKYLYFKETIFLHIKSKLVLITLHTLTKKGDCNILKCLAFFTLTLIDFKTILMNVYSNFDSMTVMTVT